MTQIMFHADAAEIFPETAKDLGKIDFEDGDYDSTDYGLSIRDAADTVALIGTLEELQAVVDKLNQQLIKLRRYEKSLARAKEKLEGRLRG